LLNKYSLGPINDTHRGKSKWSQAQHSVRSIGDGLEVKASTITGAGRGLFATVAFPSGAAITEFNAAEISRQGAEWLHRNNSPASRYLVTFAAQHTIMLARMDPIDGYGGAQFANHSDDVKQVNAKRTVIRRDIHICVVLVAVRTIQPGDEIFYRYGRSAFGTHHCRPAPPSSLVAMPFIDPLPYLLPPAPSSPSSSFTDDDDIHIRMAVAAAAAPSAVPVPPPPPPTPPPPEPPTFPIENKQKLASHMTRSFIVTAESSRIMRHSHSHPFLSFKPPTRSLIWRSRPFDLSRFDTNRPVGFIASFSFVPPPPISSPILTYVIECPLTPPSPLPYFSAEGDFI